ncbi:MAG TPA: enoyl-CoA hydratase/isomerase family protein [Dehalococcoidia bacterium]|jgi:enoyl-CoA hydratase
MSTGKLHYERLGQHVVLLEIDNPPTNTIGRAMRDALLDRLTSIENDVTLGAVILTGRGSAFCGGDDLREERHSDGGEAQRMDNLANFGRLLNTVECFRVPVIAAINGWCVGGGFELSLCCDIRIASTKARFVCAGVNVGLTASGYRLPRLIGVGPAKHMLLTGLPNDAEAAHRFGLVTALHAPDELLPAARTLAERIASRAPLSVEATKRIAGQAPDLNPAEAGQVQLRELIPLVRSADHAEAVAAFLEKRDPLFTRS